MNAPLAVFPADVPAGNCAATQHYREADQVKRVRSSIERLLFIQRCLEVKN